MRRSRRTTTLLILLHRPFHYANQTLDEETIDWNVTSISYTTLRVPNAKPLKSITLPANTTYINIFALSLLGASNSSNSVELSVQNVRSTTRWMGSNATDSDRIQVVEVTLNNLAPFDAPTSKWLTSPHNVTLTSDSIDTVIPGRVVRLRSNDQIVVKVGVTNKAGVDAGSLANVTVTLTPDGVKDTCEPAALQRAASWQITAGIPEWKNGDDSLRTHEAPDWVSAGFSMVLMSIHLLVFSTTKPSLVSLCVNVRCYSPDTVLISSRFTGCVYCEEHESRCTNQT